MCRYTDTVTKMYKYMHMYTHPQYTLTYVHLGLHIFTNIHIHRHTHTYIYIVVPFHENKNIIKNGWANVRFFIKKVANCPVSKCPHTE